MSDHLDGMDETDSIDRIFEEMERRGSECVGYMFQNKDGSFQIVWDDSIPDAVKHKIMQAGADALCPEPKEPKKEKIQ